MKRSLLTWTFCALAVSQMGVVRGDDENELIDRAMRSWHESPENWKFTALVNEAGLSVKIVTGLRNISNADRAVILLPVLGRYEFLWQGGAPESKEKKRSDDSGSGARMRVIRIVKPGETVRDSFVLEDYFYLIRGRRYTLRLKRMLDERALPGSARSAILSDMVIFVGK